MDKELQIPAETSIFTIMAIIIILGMIWIVVYYKAVHDKKKMRKEVDAWPSATTKRHGLYYIKKFP